MTRTRKRLQALGSPSRAIAIAAGVSPSIVSKNRRTVCPRKQGARISRPPVPKARTFWVRGRPRPHVCAKRGVCGEARPNSPAFARMETCGRDARAPKQSAPSARPGPAHFLGARASPPARLRAAWCLRGGAAQLASVRADGDVRARRPRTQAVRAFGAGGRGGLPGCAGVPARTFGRGSAFAGRGPQGDSMKRIDVPARLAASSPAMRRKPAVLRNTVLRTAHSLPEFFAAIREAFAENRLDALAAAKCGVL